jgi:hypothetical protein
MNYQKVEFKNQEAIEITTAQYKMILLADKGPRITFFGKKDGENLLFWDEADTLKRGDWKIMGGHRPWVTRPKADECEDTYRPDNNPCEVTIAENRIQITAPVDPLLATRKGIAVSIGEKGEFLVDNFAINESDLLYSCAMWGVTCTNPGKDRSYVIPLGDGSDWDCFKMVYFKKFGAGAALVNDPQISLTEDCLYLKPNGVQNKRGIEAPYGTIMMDVPDQETAFIKKVAYDINGTHPMGCNLAFYVAPDNLFVEMESMSPEQTLKPGSEIHWVEKWLLTEKSIGTKDVTAILNCLS